MTADVGATKENKKRIYPCARCGKLRSKAEGGTTFTVCDECWDATSLSRLEVREQSK